jgi:hypothetical protein
MSSKKDASRVYLPVGVHPSTRSGGAMRKYLAGATMLVVVVVIWFVATGGSSSGAGQHADLHAATWNIAAINNNPFEYWITHSDPAYNNMMDAVQAFIENPGAADVKVSEVFTQEMFDSLAGHMEAVGWSGVAETRAQWEGNYKDRKIISEFMQDGELGLKRLASMPDRTTNTVDLADGTAAFRPTVINCYGNHIKDLDAWFQQWAFFMFKQRMRVPDKNAEGGVAEKSGCVHTSRPPPSCSTPARGSNSNNSAELNICSEDND